MKKSTLESLYTYFVKHDDTVDLSVLTDEIRSEWERMQEKANANRSIYESAKEVAFSILCDKPMTVKEIYAAGEGQWPDGFTAAKVQYAVLHYWNDEIIKHDNGKSAFTYSLK